MCNCKCCGWLKKLFASKDCCKDESCCSDEKTNNVATPEATPEVTPETTPEAPASEEASTVENVERTE